MKDTLSRLIGAVLAVGLIGGALGFIVGVLEMTRGEGIQFTILGLFAASLLYWIVLRGPLGRAIGSMLEGEAAQDVGTLMRIEDVEDQVQALSLETQRLLEIEERLEFTERLLAKQSDPQAGEG
jgi:hypothetical protein